MRRSLYLPHVACWASGSPPFRKLPDRALLQLLHLGMLGESGEALVRCCVRRDILVESDIGHDR